MLKRIATLETERLVLRPFFMSDAPVVQRLAGDYAIAKTTATIPHPYEDGMAEEWIATHEPNARAGKGWVWAVTRRADDALLGAVGLGGDAQNESAELGYWIGKPYWGSGFGTEAARAVVAHGFAALNLRRIHARHMAGNPASGRIMQKIGMVREGRLREAEVRWGERHDMVLYAILRSEYER